MLSFANGTLAVLFVESSVNALMSKNDQIFNPVVRFDTVNVMNNLSAPKNPAKMYLHDETMFQNILVNPVLGSVRPQHLPITVPGYSATGLKRGIAFGIKPDMQSPAFRTHPRAVSRHWLGWVMIYRHAALRTFDFHLPLSIY